MFIDGNSTIQNYNNYENYTLTDDELDTINTSSTATLYLGDRNDACTYYYI